MPAEQAVPQDHPLMKGWTAFQLTDEYKNAFKWAGMVEHRCGSMWRAYLEGWAASEKCGVYRTNTAQTQLGALVDARDWLDRLILADDLDPSRIHGGLGIESQTLADALVKINAAISLAKAPAGDGSGEAQVARAVPAATESAEDYYPSHEALHDLVSLIAEHEALNGGGPGWSERWNKALATAEEIVRVEP